MGIIALLMKGYEELGINTKKGLDYQNLAPFSK